MERITNKHLENQLDTINQLTTGSTVAQTFKEEETDDGQSALRWRAIPGAYAIDQAYGGVKLVRYSDASGGEGEITPCRLTRRELYYVMQGIINTLQHMEVAA
jgi:hypothetical protein